jgi:hypothetical protein
MWNWKNPLENITKKQAIIGIAICVIVVLVMING